MFKISVHLLAQGKAGRYSYFNRILLFLKVSKNSALIVNIKTPRR